QQCSITVQTDELELMDTTPHCLKIYEPVKQEVQARSETPFSRQKQVAVDEVETVQPHLQAAQKMTAPKFEQAARYVEVRHSALTNFKDKWTFKPERPRFGSKERKVLLSSLVQASKFSDI